MPFTRHCILRQDNMIDVIIFNRSSFRGFAFALCQSTSMSKFLKEVSLRSSHKQIVIIMDQTSWYTSYHFIRPTHITFHYLLPYRPKLSPVKHFLNPLEPCLLINFFLLDLTLKSHSSRFFKTSSTSQSRVNR